MTKKVEITLSDKDAKAVQEYVRERQEKLSDWQREWVGDDAAELSADPDPSPAEAVAFVIAEKVRNR